ncbi:hypothetical protein Dimus_006971 [Dionaea muscipula]
MKPFQRFIHFLVMKNVVPRFGKRDTSSFMDLTYMDHLISRRLVNLPRVIMRHMSYVISMKDHKLPYGDWLTMVFEEFESGENRRRDDAPEEEGPAEDVHEEEEEGQTDFDWEAVIDEPAVEGESGSGEQFYDAEDEVQESPEVNEEDLAVTAQGSVQPKVTEAAGVDPSAPSGHLPESEMLKIQAEFERTRANRFQADLEKAQAENARLLALL